MIEIFCIFDEFSKCFIPELEKSTISAEGKCHRNCSCQMFDSEVMTILMLFYTKPFRELKSFYWGLVCQYMSKDFTHRFSCSCFVECQDAGQCRWPTPCRENLRTPWWTSMKSCCRESREWWVEECSPIEDTRNCSIYNFAINLLARLIVYNLLPKNWNEYRNLR